MTAPGAAAQPKTFEARCDQCNVVRTFEEFSRERRRLAPQRGEMAGGIQFEWEFSFRCQTCGFRTDKVRDTKGFVHKWTGRTHTTFRPG